jgi:hypothetical protein
MKAETVTSESEAVVKTFWEAAAAACAAGFRVRGRSGGQTDLAMDFRPTVPYTGPAVVIHAVALAVDLSLCAAQRTTVFEPAIKVPPVRVSPGAAAVRLAIAPLAIVAAYAAAICEMSHAAAMRRPVVRQDVPLVVYCPVGAHQDHEVRWCIGINS